MHKKGGRLPFGQTPLCFPGAILPCVMAFFHEYYCQKAVFFLIILKNQKKYFILHGKAKIA